MTGGAGAGSHGGSGASSTAASPRLVGGAGDAVVHEGATCDNCNMNPIIGVRYRCQECYEYDLCEACEALNVHNADHTLVKLRKPAAQNSAKRGRAAFVSDAFAALSDAESEFALAASSSSAGAAKHAFGATRHSEYSAALVSDVSLEAGRCEFACTLSTSSRTLFSSQALVDVAPSHSRSHTQRNTLPFFAFRSRSVVGPKQALLKSWAVSNDGERAWPEGTRVVLVGGHHLTNTRDVFPVAACAPGDVCEVSVVIDTPARAGTYTASYSLIASGRHFGDKLPVEIVVAGDEDAAPAAAPSSSQAVPAANDSEMDGAAAAALGSGMDS